jgi:Tfp pilus assembly protein PilX
MMRHVTLRRKERPRQRGVALVIGLIFLLMLTLISVIAMRGTSMEMMMSTAGARSLRALELSERGRREVTGSVLSGILTDGAVWNASRVYTTSDRAAVDLQAIDINNNYAADPLASEIPSVPASWVDDFTVTEAGATARIAVVRAGVSERKGGEINNIGLKSFLYFKVRSTVDAPDGSHAQTIASYRYGIRN